MSNILNEPQSGESGDEPYEYGMELVNDFLTTIQEGKDEI